MLNDQFQKVVEFTNLLSSMGLDHIIQQLKIVVIGNQSCGKSSTIEQILGYEFIPRSNCVQTRRPLQIRCRNVAGLVSAYVQFDQMLNEKGQKLKHANLKQVRQIISRQTHMETGYRTVSDKPIKLTIKSDRVPNITIIDLPGISRIPVGSAVNFDIYKTTTEIISKYIAQQQAIILGVVPANQDIAYSDVVQLINKLDPSGVRSIICVTKIDIMDRGTDAFKLLKGEEVWMRGGFVGVKNRSQQDIYDGVKLQQSLKMEQQFFMLSPIYTRLPSHLYSTNSLVKRLGILTEQQLKSQYPKILSLICTTKQQITHTLPVSSRPQQAQKTKKLSSILKRQLNKIHHNLQISMQIQIQIADIDCKEQSVEPFIKDIRQILFGIYARQLEKSQAGVFVPEEDVLAVLGRFCFGCDEYYQPNAFLFLIAPHLKQLKGPAQTACKEVHQLLQTRLNTILTTMSNSKCPLSLPQKRQKVTEILQNNLTKLLQSLQQLFQAQIYQIFTNNKQFNSSIEAQLNRPYKQNLLNKPQQLTKDLNNYSKLVISHLRDLVPKQAILFLIAKTIQSIDESVDEGIKEVIEEGIEGGDAEKEQKEQKGGELEVGEFVKEHRHTHQKLETLNKIKKLIIQSETLKEFAPCPPPTQQLARKQQPKEQKKEHNNALDMPIKKMENIMNVNMNMNANVSGVGKVEQTMSQKDIVRRMQEQRKRKLFNQLFGL